MMKNVDGNTRRFGKVFNEVAEEYDRNRPTYPDKLIDQACQIADLHEGDAVLEVGCGSGQLTRSLAARGLNITALEPGEQLLALAKRNLQGAKNVEFINARFEDAALPARHYKAVFSASAFHWIDPKVGWQKAADLLVPGGILALVQYFGQQEAWSASDQEALLSAMRAIAPDIAATWPTYHDVDTTIAGIQQRRNNISKVWAWLGNYDMEQPYVSQLFNDVEIAIVPSRIEQSADELNALTRTMSYYARLTPDQRQALEDENKAISTRLGRPLRVSIMAVLVTAQSKRTPWSTT
jgi:ubiquinone/menaquinone biosynthesis C-methylase UbiE